MDSEEDDDVFKKKSPKKKKEKSKRKKEKRESPVKKSVSREETPCCKKNIHEPEINPACHVEVQSIENDDTIESVYCPLCQAPLHYLKILPAVHVATCIVDTSTLPECPSEVYCINDSIFHYRDFRHSTLAAHRSSKGYVSPRVKKTACKSKSKKSTSSRKKDPGKFEPDHESGNSVKRKLSYGENSTDSKSKRTKAQEKVPNQKSNEVELSFNNVVIKEENIFDVLSLEFGDSSSQPPNLNQILRDPLLEEDIRRNESIKKEITDKNSSKNTPQENMKVKTVDETNKFIQIKQTESYETQVSYSIDISNHGVKSEICSADFELEPNSDSLPKKMDDMEKDLFLSDEEFEKYFEKYNDNNFDSKNTSNPTSNLCISEDKKLPSDQGKSSKDQWKQILKPKAIPSNNSRSTVSSHPQKVYSKSKVIINEEKPSSEPTQRVCPFYKKIPGTTFVVDAFSYGIIPGVTSYFLSHFHADHYIGLRKSFCKPIYCSKITASLVSMKIRVSEEYLRILDLNEPRIINQVEVTVLDANHCPGSLMFLFRLPNNQQYLHVGDFRACKEMESLPILRTAQISALFLDTTYCNPVYTFPLQKDIISKVVDVVVKRALEHPKLLVVCGSYTIGKEKVFLGILEKFKDWKLWANSTKQKILQILDNPLISSKLVSSPQEAEVHVLSMKELNFLDLKNHLKKMKGAFSHVLAFKPTGWEMSKGSKFDNLNCNSNQNITIYGVPYSEHSSYDELCRFTKFISPAQVIPTVNVGNPAGRNKMKSIIDKWLQSSKSEQTSLKTFF